MNYAELHCHSYYSFHDGASSLEELLLRFAKAASGIASILYCSAMVLAASAGPGPALRCRVLRQAGRT